MKVERTKDEIIIKLSANIDITELQNMIDYLDYKEQTSVSKANQKDVDELSKNINKSIWTKFKESRKL